MTFHDIGGCCDRLTISSSGAALSNQASVLGTYRKDGISNGRDLYKKDNDQELYLHRNDKFGEKISWMVSIWYYS